ncbi:PH domain-containing protein [Corynebacterium sp.]|uniref:PH domain-containing protein n=1 Tax=Corynebacterium sp. TaxID=1720 RepID=UPI002A90DBF8|nr:PH domain-containing protein [Corynebacterium sp.]MDY5785933.1 PH domain-containing protein [Corynebacterium sp.]
MVPYLVRAVIVGAVLVGLASWAVAEWGAWWWIAVAIAAVYIVWHLVLIPFQVRNLGWLETDNELLLSRGKMWHTLTVIPYGRIQFVDVTSGPIGRALGLKNLIINTASSTSNSRLPGVPAEEADALRERLAVKARERMSGL